MKELSIEEKARRYDEAIERAKSVIEQNPLMEYLKKGIEYIFTELKESEDEKIRKWIKKELASKYVVDNIVNNMMADKAFAWLEKKGEQKPAWSEDDTQYINDTLALLSFECSIHSIGEVQEWLQSLSNRVQLKQEWSEEDETKRNALISLVEEIKNQPLKRLEDWDGYISWLKSLRPQSQWKPSDKQMKVIEQICDGNYNVDLDILDSIYRDFKKLRRNSYESKRTRKDLFK